MSKTFHEMIEMYREVVNRFNKIELNEWNAQGTMIELTKQVGELSKWVMIKEKYIIRKDKIVCLTAMKLEEFMRREIERLEAE